MFGDNLVDFADFSKTSESDRDKQLEELQKNSVKNSSCFPNPMYGSWESAVYAGNKLDAKRSSRRNAKKPCKVLINKINKLILYKIRLTYNLKKSG